LKINLDKSIFGNKEVSYLGFTLTPEGIKPRKNKLKEFKVPRHPPMSKPSALSWGCATSSGRTSRTSLSSLLHFLS
jgi:hypothetical protein